MLALVLLSFKRHEKVTLKKGCEGIGIHRRHQGIYLQCSNHADRPFDRLLKLVLVRLQQVLQVRQQPAKTIVRKEKK